MFEVTLVPLLVHRLVGARLALLQMALEKLFVAALEQIDLRVEQGRVGGLVELAVLLAEEAVHARSPLRGELAVEDDDVSLLVGVRVGLRGRWQRAPVGQQPVVDGVLGVEVDGAADVAAVELVRVPGRDGVARQFNTSLHRAHPLLGTHGIANAAEQCHPNPTEGRDANRIRM